MVLLREIEVENIVRKILSNDGFSVIPRVREQEVDIQATIDKLKKLDKDREELELKVKQDLKELGFRI